MNIEVYTPGKEVKEWIVSYVRDAIIALHDQHKEISRGEIYFKDKTNEEEQGRVCEISLSIFQNSITVSGFGNTFDEAAKKAVADLNNIISQTFKTNAEPPDEIVSTVDA